MQITAGFAGFDGSGRSSSREFTILCPTPLPGLAVNARVPDDTMMSNSLDTLTVETFQPRIGQTFRIRPHPDADVSAELIEARPLGEPGRATASKRRMPFTLSFRTNLNPVLPQRIYEVAHDEMGTYEIFLVPVGPDGTGMVYEAIFT